MVALKRFAGLLLAPMMVVAASAAPAEEVGKVGVDWLGNDIVIDAVQDPKVQGVTCHLASFSRGMIDRLQKGNWFEDPSNASISCEQTGPITIGDIDLGKGGPGLVPGGRCAPSRRPLTDTKKAAEELRRPLQSGGLV